MTANPHDSVTAAPATNAPRPHADEDGTCTRCGLEFEDPDELTHECPPGFAQQPPATRKWTAAQITNALYYEQKDGCTRGHNSMCGKICYGCVEEALAQTERESQAAQGALLKLARGVALERARIFHSMGETDSTRRSEAEIIAKQIADLSPSASEARAAHTLPLAELDAFARRCINAARVYPKLDIDSIVAAVRAKSEAPVLHDGRIRHEMNQRIGEHLRQDANAKSTLQMLDDALAAHTKPLVEALAFAVSVIKCKERWTTADDERVTELLTCYATKGEAR